MKRLPDSRSGFAVVELLVAIVIVGILIYMAIPNVACGPDRSRMTQALANARSLQQATQMMTLDEIETPGGALIDWTSVKSRSCKTPSSRDVFRRAREERLRNPIGTPKTPYRAGAPG